ncbi:MAG: PKD domain-containing protein, partial [Bacteroidota bacterium]
MKKIVLLLLIAPLFCFGQDVLIENGTFNICQGTFLDTGGGGAGQYSNNENIVMTICPDTPGDIVQLDFTSFALQDQVDFMNIYNGPDTTAPQFGAYTGTISPGIVAATNANPSGCITIEFISDAAGVNIGWAATISCVTPCQIINSQLDSSVPAVDQNGIIEICQGDTVTFNGSATFSSDGTGAQYQWDFGDGNSAFGESVTHTFPNPGAYIVNLNVTDTNNCTNDNLINQVVRVSTTPDFTGTEATDPIICFGDSTTLTGVVAATPFTVECTPPVSGLTFLPDGSGVSYETSVTVDCFESDQVLTSGLEILEICLNIEHSYTGDLEIIITSPNGQQALLLDYPNSGGNTFLGAPIDNDADLTEGVGADYCFSLAGTVNLDNGPTTNLGSGTAFQPGAYLPVDPNGFDDLIGSPLNGDWTIRVTDNLGSDNGYIFRWSLEFDPSILPADESFTPVIETEAWVPDPTITNTAGNVITVQPTTPGQYCYTYEATDDLGCTYTETVCIDVTPEINNALPSNLSECSNNVTEVFDLTVNTPVVLAPIVDTTDMEVTYHLSQADADAGINALTAAQAQAYTVNLGTVDTIYVRISYTGTNAIDCFQVESFTVSIGNTTVSAVPDIELCDIGNDGAEEFDLCVQTPLALGTQDPANYTVSYHDTQADADNNVNPLPCLYTNTTAPVDDIYIRVQDNNSPDCFAVTSFDLILNAEPTLITPPDMVVCDDASNDGVEMFNLADQIPVILGTQNPTDFTLSFHGSVVDADANANPLPTMYTNVNQSDLIVVRVEDNTTNCVSTVQFNVVVDDLPIANTVLDITVCDDDTNDGQDTFNLSTLDAQVLGAQDPTNFNITYHPTLLDATNNANAYATNHTATNGDEIHVRIENSNNGECFDTTSFFININYQPTAVAPVNIVVCDDTSNDGFETFDLTAEIPVIIGTQDPTQVNVNFHTTEADAIANTNPIGTPNAYTNASQNSTDIIYVSVTSSDPTNSCATTTSFTVTVNALPIPVVPTTLEECDDDTDGFVGFTLTDADAEILAGQTSTDPITITYYEDQLDAQNGTGTPLMSPYVNTTVNNQTVYIRIVNDVTGCVNTSSVDLQVNPGIVATTPANYTVCDDTNGNDEDGLGTFDLSTLDAQVLGALAGTATATYYETEAEAQAGDPTTALPTMYTTTTAPLQMIFVRVTDDITGCFDVVEATLIVDPLPNLDNIPPMIACDFNNPGDMMEMFDLSTHTTVVANGQVGLTITYHLSEADAEADANAQTNITGNDGQMVWVRAVNPLGCVQVGSFELQVPQLPVIAVPTVLEACDDETADGVAPTDLTVKNDEITISNPDLNVSYHLTN